MSKGVRIGQFIEIIGSVRGTGFPPQGVGAGGALLKQFALLRDSPLKFCPKTIEKLAQQKNCIRTDFAPSSENNSWRKAGVSYST